MKALSFFILFTALTGLSTGEEKPTAAGPHTPLMNANREKDLEWTGSPKVSSDRLEVTKDYQEVLRLEHTPIEKAEDDDVIDVINNLRRHISSPWFCRSQGKDLSVINLRHKAVELFNKSNDKVKGWIKSDEADRRRLTAALDIRDWNQKSSQLDTYANTFRFSDSGKFALRALILGLVQEGEFVAASFYFDAWLEEQGDSPANCDEKNLWVMALGVVAQSGAGRHEVTKTLDFLKQCDKPATFEFINGDISFDNKTERPPAQWKENLEKAIEANKGKDPTIKNWFVSHEAKHSEAFLRKERVRRALTYSNSSQVFVQLMHHEFPGALDDLSFCELYSSDSDGLIPFLVGREAKSLHRDYYRLAKVPERELPEVFKLLKSKDYKTKHGAQKAIERAGYSDALSELRSATFSPDGKTILTTITKDCRLDISSTETGKLIQSFSTDGEPITSAEFSPDRKLILTVTNLAGGKIWDATTGKLVGTLIGADRLNFAQFSHDGKKIVSTTVDGIAQIWAADTGKQLETLTPPPAKDSMGRKLTDHLASAQFSHDGKTILTSSKGGYLGLWDTVTGSPLRKQLASRTMLTSAQFSADGKMIVTTTYGEKMARTWDTKALENGRTLYGHTDMITSAEFSPDGEKILTASSDKTARIWDAKTGKLLDTLSQLSPHGLESAKFSPDGKTVVTIAHMTAQLWRLEDGHNWQLDDIKYRAEQFLKGTAAKQDIEAFQDPNTDLQYRWRNWILALKGAKWTEAQITELIHSNISNPALATLLEKEITPLFEGP